MILRGVFVADGSADLPLAIHLEALCADFGLDVRIATPDPRRSNASSRTVADRLVAIAQLGDPFDIAFVHRDAEAQPAEARRAEISLGAQNAGITQPVVPVVPVRMTEAWLLLDEQMIRTVAGRPNGTGSLGLPLKVHQLKRSQIQSQFSEMRCRLPVRPLGVDEMVSSAISIGTGRPSFSAWISKDRFRNSNHGSSWLKTLRHWHPASDAGGHGRRPG
jgi:hypothetical protein